MSGETEGVSLESAVHFEGLSVTLSGVSILEDVRASVPMGGCTAIVGPNGAGKTTLILALLGQIPYQGRILFRGCRTNRSPRIGYVPQRLSFDRGMPVTVAEFLAMDRQRTPLWLGIRKRIRDEVRDLLRKVDAVEIENRQLGALSGGELQRILLALALQREPELLVLDEPASGIDFKGERLFCELLESLRRSIGFTQLMVSHDLATVSYHATHVICLNRRVAAEGMPKEVLTPKNLEAVFGLHMGLVDSKAMAEPPVCSVCSGREGA
jgi:zinc transport system ATP-binding protein